MNTTNRLTTYSQSVHTLGQSFSESRGVVTAADSLLGWTGFRAAVQDASYLSTVVREMGPDGRGYFVRETCSIRDLVAFVV